MVFEFWNSPEILIYSCFYDDVELISVMIIYCSLLYWIIAYCLPLSLTLDSDLWCKCCPSFLFSVSTSQKWVFSASNCQVFVSYSKQGILPNFARGIREISGDFFLALGWKPWLIINKRESTGLSILNILKLLLNTRIIWMIFIENIEKYNSGKILERKILMVFKDMIVDMLRN